MEKLIDHLLDSSVFTDRARGQQGHKLKVAFLRMIHEKLDIDNFPKASGRVINPFI